MAPGPLSLCLKAVRWAPVLFITAVVVWSYYAYVIQMCIFAVDSVAEKVVYLILYHPILFMFAWAYWKTIFTEVGKVPKQFYLSKTDLERFEREDSEDIQRDILAKAARNLPVQCRTISGAIRYCEKCKSIKPDRAHHCSVCGRCVLKMDHHCPWVNNCVNFTNYKFFVLFLGYALIYCLYVAATSLQYFIQFWTNGASGGYGKFHILFLFFAASMFAISLVSLFGYHLYLSSVNRSTLESFRSPIFRSGPDKDGFSLGRHGNFLEIFGEDRKLWFLPMFSSCGEGVTFPTRVPPSSSYHSMGNTPSETLPSDSATPHSPQPPLAPPLASVGDGVTYPTRTVDEDFDSLLGQRQRWAEEGDADGALERRPPTLFTTPGTYENRLALSQDRSGGAGSAKT